MDIITADPITNETLKISISKKDALRILNVIIEKMSHNGGFIESDEAVYKEDAKLITTLLESADKLHCFLDYNHQIWLFSCIIYHKDKELLEKVQDLIPEIKTSTNINDKAALLLHDLMQNLLDEGTHVDIFYYLLEKGFKLYHPFSSHPTALLRYIAYNEDGSADVQLTEKLFSTFEEANAKRATVIDNYANRIPDEILKSFKRYISYDRLFRNPNQ